MRVLIFSLSFILFFLQTSRSQTEMKKLPVTFSQLIFQPQEKHAHGSTLVCLPNGDLLCAWFMGSGERTADDVKIMGSRFIKGTNAWTAPFEMADSYGLPDCNPVLFLNSANKLFLVWITVMANQWESSVLRVKTTTDYALSGAPVWQWQDDILLKPGETFARDVEEGFKKLPSQEAGWSAYAAPYDQQIKEASKDSRKRSFGWMTRIKPLQLSSGRILLPLYSDGFNFSMMAISDDNGASWRASAPIIGRGNVQPALARKKDGSIVAFMRDNGDAPPRVQKSVSVDEGKSWTVAQKTTLPNTASVEILGLKDGRWLFVGNTIEDGRYKLSLYLSENEGETFTKFWLLENSPKGQGSFSYPSLNQSVDGKIHISYSYQQANAGECIKYVQLDAAQLH
jgi:predicted neuraminidase